MTIREARLNAGLSQQKMSDLLNIPKRTIEDWESGKRIPPEYVKSLVIDKLEQIKQVKTVDAFLHLLFLLYIVNIG